jgi:hypothetical protein
MPGSLRLCLLSLLVFSCTAFGDADQATSSTQQAAAQTTPPPGVTKKPTTKLQPSPDTVQKAGTGSSAAQNSTAAPVIPGVSGIVAPGSLVTIRLADGKPQSVNLHSVNDPSRELKFDALAGRDSTSDGFKVKLPDQMDPGSYYFTLADNNNQIIPGSIDVQPDKIKLIAVSPATAYRGDTSRFNFDIIGENFSTDDPKSNDVTLEGQGSIVNDKDKHGGEADCKQSKDTCLWVESNRLMHIVGYHARAYQGVVNVGVRVGNVTASDQKQLVLARRSGTFVFILSAVLTGVLFLIVSFVVGSGVEQNKMGGRRRNLLQSFIFDPETNSYSLSKFQLLVFSVTFIFGYFYVLLSRWLVQWQFTLPDVPSTIAGLLGISGGTTVAAIGLTSSRGAKGAGLEQPTGADLISTGGVVVPERFQFFVWTIVACGGFIALLIGQDPAKVSNFPDLPSGLLYVMGVSAAGYLGGKATRKPGPVLEYIGFKRTPAPKNPTVQRPTLTLQGQNLAMDGHVFIDGMELDFPSDADQKEFGVEVGDKLVTGTPQPGAADTSFCKELVVTVANSAINLNLGHHTVRLVNRDGQFADISFTDKPPSIAAVYEKGKEGTTTLRATEQQVIVIIRGTGFPSGSLVDWQAPGPDSVFKTQTLEAGGAGDGTELWVSLVPGVNVGSGMIRVTTSDGGVLATATVQVAKTP